MDCINTEYMVGDKIYFAEEKKPYTVRACDSRYLICTKPYNFRPKTVIYTIVDLKEDIRGTDGYALGGYDYYRQEDCESFLKELQGAVLMKREENGVIIDIGGTHISFRNRIKLNIVNSEFFKKQK